MMKIRYDAEADVLMLVFRDEPPIDAIEDPGGVIVSYGKDRTPVSVEFLQASVNRLVQGGRLHIEVE